MKRKTGLLASGLRHHRSGDLARAESKCRRILRTEPRNAEALHLLGVTACESGDLAKAATLIAKAIQVRGPLPVYCLSLAQVLRRQGNREAALACYRQALAGAPDDPELLHELGGTLLELGRAAEAVVCFERALRIRPDLTATRLALAEALHALGNIRFLSRKFDDARECYRATIGLNPDHAQAHYNLGVTYMHQGRSDAAIRCYREALRLYPDHAEARNNLGILLQAAGRLEEAAEEYRHALELNPAYSDAEYNLGTVLRRMDRPEEAEGAYRRVIHRSPSHADARNNLANALMDLGRPREARAVYEEVLKLRPEHRDARWNLGIAELLLGDFEAGWQDFEARLRNVSSPCQPEDHWDGSPLRGRRILLSAEQGLGDTLQFVRYVPLVKERGGFVIVQCHEPLIRLVRSMRAVDVSVAFGEPLPHFDCYAPLMSLPRILGTNEENIPARIPYLHADPEIVEHWRELVAGTRDLRVGIAWAGNPGHKNDRHRSLELAQLRALDGIPGTEFYNLQVGAQAPAEGLLRVHTPARELSDFAETAAFIRNLDLVVSVDTAVAHLAGALGGAVWTLVPFAPDWRWLLEREDSPWYPTMRLFRQTSRNDWQPVLERVRRELLARVPLSR